MEEHKKGLWEKLMTSNYLYRGKIITVRRDQVLTPVGREPAFREVVEHPGAVAILALDHQRRIVLVRQYRHAVGRVMLEVPAGKLEPGEDPLLCARRELAEETGCRGGNWKKLNWFYSSPGFCDEKIHLFLAEGVVAGDPAPSDENEVLEPCWIEPGSGQQLVRENKISDAKTIIALQFAAALEAQS